MQYKGNDFGWNGQEVVQRLDASVQPLDGFFVISGFIRNFVAKMGISPEFWDYLSKHYGT